MDFPWDRFLLALIAFFNAAGFYFAWRAKMVAVETQAIVGQTHTIAVETRELAEKTEINTNSMKDALVKATGEAAHAAGKEEGRSEGEAKAVIVAGLHPTQAQPLPVADNRTAEATERTAAASERSAAAAERSADVIEKKWYWPL